MTGRRAVLARYARRVVLVASVAYPLSLGVIALMLRYVGEAWWVTTVGLYLPAAGFALPFPFVVLGAAVARLRWAAWLQIPSAAIVLLALMGFVVPFPSSARARAPTITVLSFNVNSGHGGAQAVLDEIDSYSPDVALLQEVGSSQPFFERALRERYPTVDVAGQFVLAARYPRAIDAPGSAAPAPPDAPPRPSSFLREVLETPLGRVVVYDLHAASPRAALYGLRGREGLVREVLSGRLLRGDGAPRLASSAALRGSQVQALAEAASAETDPVIVGGDTNLPHLSPILHQYLSGYTDAFASGGWGLGYTFPTDRQWAWMRIDRILAKGLRFVKFRVGHGSASDHRCVVAEVQAL